jgi:hypothetical protein
MVSPQCSPQTSRKQTNQKSGPTLPSMTAPPPPIPPRRISPTNTPGHSPGPSPKHNVLPIKTIRISKTLTSVKSDIEKVNDTKSVFINESKAKNEHKITTDKTNESTKISHLTVQTFNPLFGTWPGAVNSVLPLNNLSSVSQSAGTSPTNIIISSPLIPRHPPPLPTQKPTDSKQLLSTNSHSIEFHNLIEEHSYANTEIIGMYSKLIYNIFPGN